MDSLRKFFQSVAPAGEYESPIEQVMAGSLHVVMTHMGRPFVLDPQVVVGQYRVDLVLSGDGFKVAIECDGHDFHEKTKHQAARDKFRDRFLTASGYTVLRFTGSEIWNAPLTCGLDAYAIAHDLWTAHELARLAKEA